MLEHIACVFSLSIPLFKPVLSFARKRFVIWSWIKGNRMIQKTLLGWRAFKKLFVFLLSSGALGKTNWCSADNISGKTSGTSSSVFTRYNHLRNSDIILELYLNKLFHKRTDFNTKSPMFKVFKVSATLPFRTVHVRARIAVVLSFFL